MPHSALNCARLAAAGALWLGAAPLAAAPRGGSVTNGQASIRQDGATTHVDQSTPRATIDWQSFSIAPEESVHFSQPSAASVTLNRVVGSEPSVLEGALSANGQVFLINAHGVLFAEGSRVDTGSLVASTLDLSDQDFLNDRYTFHGKGQGAVVNQGTLVAGTQGYVALIGKLVRNEGVIVATQGTAALASGESVTLNFNGNSLFGVSVDRGTLNALVENRRAIRADGGKVLLTAKAADELLNAQVNNSGVVQARTLGELTGSIELHAHGGTTHVDGTLDASAPNGGPGGFIETSGDHVKIAEQAQITSFARDGATGTWLVDPDGFTVAASGGDITGAALSDQLGRNNVTLESIQGSGRDGDIHVNDAVSWDADTKLTLNATKDIHFNASVTATGNDAGLSLRFGGDYHVLTPATYSGVVLDEQGEPVANQAPEGTKYVSITLEGEKASLQVNGTEYTLIHSMTELAEVRGAGHFALAGNLDAGAFSEQNPGAPSVLSELSGTLAGLGHTVSNLTLSADADSVGLIGHATNSIIRDLGVVNATIQGNSRVGALLGAASGVTLSGVYSSGSVSGISMVGGLLGATAAGNQSPSRIESSFSSAKITASTMAGGLAGDGGTLGNGPLQIQDSHATGNVSAVGSGRDAGGLVGTLGSHSSVEGSYATGNVTATGNEGYRVGGLIGWIRAPEGGVSVKSSFASGAVTARHTVGGLIGALELPNGSKLAGEALAANVDNTYATGDVTATADETPQAFDGRWAKVGGLIGDAESVNISDSHATGDVKTTGQGHLNYGGGLVGRHGKGGAITNSFATGDVSVSGSFVGGLVGSGQTIVDSYATGQVKGFDQVGALAGAAGNVSNSWGQGNIQVIDWNTPARPPQSERPPDEDESPSEEPSPSATPPEDAPPTADADTPPSPAPEPESHGAPRDGEHTEPNSPPAPVPPSSREAQGLGEPLRAANAASARAAELQRHAAAPSCSACEHPAEAVERPPPLIKSIVVRQPAKSEAASARYSTSVRRIEIDGHVFELTDDSDDARKSRKKKPAARK